MIYPDKLLVTMKVCIDGQNLDNLFLVPQIVSSAAASDEVDFRPSAMLGFKQGEGDTEILVYDVVEAGLDELKFTDHKLSIGRLEELDYLYFIHTGEANVFSNRICYNLKGNDIAKNGNKTGRAELLSGSGFCRAESPGLSEFGYYAPALYSCTGWTG